MEESDFCAQSDFSDVHGLRSGVTLRGATFAGSEMRTVRSIRRTWSRTAARGSAVARRDATAGELEVVADDRTIAQTDDRSGHGRAVGSLASAEPFNGCPYPLSMWCWIRSERPPELGMIHDPGLLALIQDLP